ncbi:DegT/DnrJ/EryC1/StrS family aminotransferase, partial [Chloroflexota bacterium]
MAMGVVGKRIPLFDAFLDEKEVVAVKEVIESGWLSQGEKVEEFEGRFSTFVGSKHAVAVSSCTAALHLSLIAAGISDGDEVITTPFTFIATINSILYQRAKPVFADIGPQTFTIDPDRILERITDRTRAIIPVHYAGQPADMDTINQVAKEYGLVVIEDAAHALGAQYHGTMVGALADYACFSFYANKHITTGEGGMVTLNDSGEAEQIRKLRTHGMTSTAFRRDRSYEWEYGIDNIGYNYRMTEVEAAIGIVQLSRINEIMEKRAKNANMLSSMFEDVEQITPQ